MPGFKLAPDGTLLEGGGGSFTRYVGLLMILATIGLVFAMVWMLAFLDVCNPAYVSTEIRTVCQPRFEPGGLAAFMTAAGGTFGATTVFLYRANKLTAPKYPANTADLGGR